MSVNPSINETKRHRRSADSISAPARDTAISMEFLKDVFSMIAMLYLTDQSSADRSNLARVSLDPLFKVSPSKDLLQQGLIEHHVNESVSMKVTFKRMVPVSTNRDSWSKIT